MGIHCGSVHNWVDYEIVYEDYWIYQPFSIYLFKHISTDFEESTFRSLFKKVYVIQYSENFLELTVFLMQ